MYITAFLVILANSYDQEFFWEIVFFLFLHCCCVKLRKIKKWHLLLTETVSRSTCGGFFIKDPSRIFPCEKERLWRSTMWPMARPPWECQWKSSGLITCPSRMEKNNAYEQAIWIKDRSQDSNFSLSTLKKREISGHQITLCQMQTTAPNVLVSSSHVLGFYVISGKCALQPNLTAWTNYLCGALCGAFESCWEFSTLKGCGESQSPQTDGQ